MNATCLRISLLLLAAFTVLRSTCSGQAVNDGTWSVAVIAGVPGQTGTVDGASGTALLTMVVALSGAGSTLYFTEPDAIRSLDLKTGIVSTVVVTPVLFPRNTIYMPVGILMAGVTLYVNNGFAAIYTANGNFNATPRAEQTSCSVPGCWTEGYADGLASSAQFSSPREMWSDGVNLYISDMGNNVIRKFSCNTHTVTTFATALISRGACGATEQTYMLPTAGPMSFARSIYPRVRFRCWPGHFPAIWMAPELRRVSADRSESGVMASICM